ncbi:MAG TPA: hypothetical protein EYP98_15060 [Planctomycetes bacterium]|nr:hypothetical protein [Planctomycetota bacterium]
MHCRLPALKWAAVATGALHRQTAQQEPAAADLAFKGIDLLHACHFGEPLGIGQGGWLGAQEQHVG